MVPLSHNLWALARVLRRFGLIIGVSDLADVEEALHMTQDFSLRGIHDVIQCLWVHSRDQRRVFDYAFTLWVLELAGISARPKTPSWFSQLPRPQKGRTRVTWLSSGDAQSMPVSDQIAWTRTRTASWEESLSTKEPGSAGDSMKDLHALALKIKRHYRQGYRQMSGKKGGRWNMPKTLRKSLTTGELMRWFYSQDRPTGRQTIFLWDVSQSMMAFLPLFFQFFYALMKAGEGTEIWSFSTRLTRVDLIWRSRPPDLAYRALFHGVPDLGGGTRLEEALLMFLTQSKSRLKHHMDMVLVTDGYESGDGGQLDNTVARLKRRSHRLIWWNPWLSSPGYEIVSEAGQILSRYCIVQQTASVDDLVRAWSQLA